MNDRTTNLVLAILGAALLLTLGLIGALSLQTPPREIPAVLLGTPPTIIAGILGMLIQRKPPTGDGEL